MIYKNNIFIDIRPSIHTKIWTVSHIFRSICTIDHQTMRMLRIYIYINSTHYIHFLYFFTTFFYLYHCVLYI